MAEQTDNHSSSYAANEASGAASPPGSAGGFVQLDQLTSTAGLLNIAVVISLLLGFICAVSLPPSGASAVDACQTIVPHIKVNVVASRVAYALFSFLGFLCFLFLLFIKSVNIPFLGTIKNLLSSILTLAIIAVFVCLMFILSATAGASERKLGAARCINMPRAGGMGAACFFGLVSILAMGGMGVLTFLGGRG